MAETFEGWAILELMGHRRLAGWVTETELAGQGVLRLDVPRSAADDEMGEEHGDPEEERWLATQFYAPSALYCLTPVDEDVARGLAERQRPHPVHPWELPAPRARADDDLLPEDALGDPLDDDDAVAPEPIVGDER